MQYIIHMKAYMACLTKVDIMLLKLQHTTISKDRMANALCANND